MFQTELLATCHRSSLYVVIAGAMQNPSIEKCQVMAGTEAGAMVSLGGKSTETGLESAAPCG